MYTPDRQINPDDFYTDDQEEREEHQCGACGERFHLTELVNLNAVWCQGKPWELTYTSLVCVPCNKGIHNELETELILKEVTNENN